MEPNPPLDVMESLRVFNDLLVWKVVDKQKELHRVQSRLDGLYDEHAFLAGVEGDVNRLVISSGLADWEVAARRGEANLLSKAAAEEERARSLQAKVDFMAEELRSVGERLEMVVGLKDGFKNALARVLQEKETSLKDLDRKEKELRALEAQVREGEIGMTEAVADLVRLEIERDVLVEQLKERGEALHSLRLERASMETSLDEYWRSVDSPESKVEEEFKIKQEEVEEVKAKKEAIAEKVSGLEAERQSLVGNNQRLEAEADGLKASVCSMKEEEKLRNEIAEMEKKNVKITEELHSEISKKEAAVKKVSTLESEIQSLLEKTLWLEVDLDISKSTVESLKKGEEGLQSQVAEMKKRNEEVSRELERLQPELKALKEEKERILIDFEGRVTASLMEFDNLKTLMREIETKKDAVEAARTAQKSEIDYLQEFLRELRSTVNELQVLCDDRANKNAQLQAERDSVWRDLDLQKPEEGYVIAKIKELKKRNNEVEEEVQQFQRALTDFAPKEEEEEWKAQSDAWKVQKTRIEQELMTARRGLFDMESKFEGSEMKSQRALSLLKNHVEEMIRLVGGNENVVERNIGREDEKDAEMLPVVKELETIKTVGGED